ncbi:MAG: serine/threonine protein kinase, partial [Myxococcales bacterium]|nr:serine/threonine protein kinase [Myxococcales bacterium]
MRLEGRTIDHKYLVGDLVAAGGMGQVYAARHLETERQVALKILRGDSLPQPEAVERLRREARAAGRIGHDNICEVLDLGRLPDGTPYLVLPLLRGKTLAAALRDSGPLPLPRVLDIGAQILAGLAAAHDAGIVHRDLKPENVFLVRMGDRDDFVKILDFGISKSVEPRPIDGSLTQTGTVLGTPHYMAPEQVRGRKDLDHRVDLYATGVLLYRMTTARLPFTGDSYSAIVSAILLDPFPPPRALRPDLPESLETVILRAMARDRNDRFPDAETMRRALLDVRSPDSGRAETPAESTQPAPAAFGDTGRGDSTPSAPTPPTGALHSVSTGSTAARRAESPRDPRR